MKQKDSRTKRKTRGNKRTRERGEDTQIGDEVYTRVNSGRSTKWRDDVAEILGGKAIIYTTPTSGGNYQFRMWLPVEKKYVFKSLKTKNKAQAISKAEDLFVSIQGKLSAGHRYFSVTFSELTEHYLRHQTRRVELGRITAGRLVTIKSQLKHFLEFVGANNRVTEVQGTTFRTYYEDRQRKNPEVKQSTLKNERSTITNLYKFGREHGYLNLDTHPAFEELRFSAPGRRKAFLDADYRVFYEYLRRWDKDAEDATDLYCRQLIRDFILIKANSGLRFGELNKIRWDDVSVHRKGSKSRWTADIYVNERIAKTRRDRTAICLRGDLFDRIKKYSEFTRPKDFVFADPITGDLMDKGVFYRYWRKIMEETGLNESGRDYTYYSLRHYFATKRLQDGKVDVFTLSKIMGTSVKNIEDHYGQIEVAEMRDYIARRNF